MQVAVRRLLHLWCCLALLLVAGCSLFDGRKDSLADYDSSSEPDGLSWKGVKEKALEMTGNGPDPALSRQRFQEAQVSYEQAAREYQPGHEAARSQFLDAAEQFDEAADRWPDSSVAEQSLYFAGESHFFADQYPEAEEAYATLVKEYPHTRYLDLAQARRFEIAQYWLALHEEDPRAFYEFNLTDDSQPMRDAFGRAMIIFDRIRLDDPTGKLADDATLAMGNAYFKIGKFLRADEYYTDLRKTFPNSDHQFRAHFLGLKAKMESYEGVEYTEKPLKEADKLLKQIQRQFPMEAQREREFLARAAAEVQYSLAERTWHRAKRHDRRAEYGAAKMYYEELVRDYGRTPFGQQARSRLGEIGGRPAIPPQSLGWLADLFPEEQTVKPMIATGSGSQRR